jgi:hypothetical protein
MATSQKLSEQEAAFLGQMYIAAKTEMVSVVHTLFSILAPLKPPSPYPL